jgi:hypothetical protein
MSGQPNSTACQSVRHIRLIKFHRCLIQVNSECGLTPMIAIRNEGVLFLLLTSTDNIG